MLGIVIPGLPVITSGEVAGDNELVFRIPREELNHIVVFLTGEKDPLSKQGKTVRQLLSLLAKLGKTNVASHFYPEGRHEILNCKERDQVLEDILSWIDVAVPIIGRRSD